MKRIFLLFVVQLIFLLNACAQTEDHSYGNNSKAGHYAIINGIQLYYEIYGTGEPLVLLHGNGGSINAFRKQIPFFEKYYRVIAIDSRLQGKSGGSPNAISYELMASDFCALLDHLNIRSAYVLGWSDGGIDGILMALQCPDRVKKLAVSGANTVPDSTALYQDDIDGMKKFVANPGNASATSIALTKMMIDQPNIPYSDLKRIACPTLVMAGDHDMIRAEHTLKIYQSIPSAMLCIFPDSEHGVCQQHPDLFNQTVLTFFQK
jgi:pimeloyl-ACP methyl ester carboxylesterase